MSGSSDGSVEIRITGSVDASVAASTAQAAGQMEGLAEAATVTSSAMKAEAAATEVSSVAHGRNRAVTESLVIAHEALSGRLSRIPGSFMILAQAVTGADTAMLLMGAGVLAVVGGFGYLAYEALEAEKNLDHLTEGFALTGRAAEMSRDAVAYEIDFLSRLPGSTAEAAEGFLKLAAEHSNWSASLINETGQLMPAFIDLYGKDAPQAVAKLTETLADLTESGFQKLDRELLNLSPAEYELIENLIKTGQTAQATSEIMKALSENSGIYIKSLGDQVYDIEQKMAAVQARMNAGNPHNAMLEGQMSGLQAQLAAIRQMESSQGQQEGNNQYKAEADDIAKTNERLNERATITARIAQLNREVKDAFSRGDDTKVGQGTQDIQAEQAKLAALDKKNADEGFNAFRESEDAKADLLKSGSAARVAIYQQEADRAKATFGDQSNEYLRALERVNTAQRESSEQGAQAAQRAAEQQTRWSREASTELEEMNKSDAATDVTIAKQALEQKKQFLSEEYAAHRITAQQKYDATVQAVEGEAAAERAAQDQILNDSTASIVQMEAAENQKRLIDAQTNEQIAAAHRALTEELKQEDNKRLQSWRTIDSEITSAESQLVSDVFNKRQNLGLDIEQIGYRTLEQETANLLKTLTEHELVNLGILASDKATAQEGLLYKLGAYLADQTGLFASEAAKTAANATGAAAGKALQAAENVSSAESNAAVAATGAAAAVAATPVVGPALAEASAAAVFASMQGYVGLASAAGGEWNTGSGGLYQLHEREAVMPAKVADPMRDFFEGGHGSGAGQTNIFHNTIHPGSSRSIADELDEHSSDVIRIMNQWQRDGRV